MQPSLLIKISCLEQKKSTYDFFVLYRIFHRYTRHLRNKEVAIRLKHDCKLCSAAQQLSVISCVVPKMLIRSYRFKWQVTFEFVKLNVRQQR